MTLTIILEGSNNVGKTTICEKIQRWFNHLKLNYVYFHDSDLYESVVGDDDHFSLDDIIDERNSLYSEMREEYDIILLDRSFMSTIIYNLDMSDTSYIEPYIEKELLNLRPTPHDNIIIFVLVRDANDILSKQYVKLSHELLLEKHIDSNVIYTNEDLEHTLERIKTDIFDELIITEET